MPLGRNSADTFFHATILGISRNVRTLSRSAPSTVVGGSRFFPPGGHSGEPWEYLFYSNLVAAFLDEICDNDRASQGDFAQGAMVQETINAFEASFRARAWTCFPLDWQ